MSRAKPIRVLFADDHTVVREGMRRVLSPEHGFDVVGEAATGAQAVALAQSLQPPPDVVVLDISMPELSGLEAAERIRDSVPDAAVLMLSMHDHDEYVRQSMRAGAQGYLLKDAPPSELRRAVQLLSDGGSFFTDVARRASARAAAAAREQPNPDTSRRIATLSPREREVLISIAQGNTNKEIARQFGISVRTVESHRESLMKKLEVHGAASLTRFAIDAGLLNGRTGR